MGRAGEDRLIDAWPVVSYTVGAALELMALLDVEAELGVVAAVEGEADAGASEASKISGGCHVGDERVKIHYSIFIKVMTTSGITCRDRAQGGVRDRAPSCDAHALGWLLVGGGIDGAMKMAM